MTLAGSDGLSFDTSSDNKSYLELSSHTNQIACWLVALKTSYIYARQMRAVYEETHCRERPEELTYDQG